MDQLTRIENKLDRQSDKQDKMWEDIASIRTNVAINTADLMTHIKRTQLLEDMVLPMRTKWAMFEGALKLIGLLGIVAGIADVILRLLHR